MAPPLSPKELDLILRRVGEGSPTPSIHQELVKMRARAKSEGPDITTVRRAVRGKTHKRGAQERRGRKRKLSTIAVRRLNKTRKELIKKAAGEYEVHWKDMISKARVPRVHASTASRSLKRIGENVAFRTPRTKPMRESADEKERVSICTSWLKRPKAYFTEKLDCIMDNKHFDIPTYTKAKKFHKMRRVRGHLRTKAEGVKKGFTKPSYRKNRVNPGAKATVRACIINNKVKVWEYLPDRWCGAAAADLYEKVVIKALRKHRGNKKSFLMLEDNDPTGYKSGLAVDAKKRLKINTIPFPKYSPDLNPLDFFLWNEVERLMSAQKAPAHESVEAYKERLKKTAMAIPSDVIKRAVESIQVRAKQVVAAKGGDIQRD
jgi:hypothetical protein